MRYPIKVSHVMRLAARLICVHFALNCTLAGIWGAATLNIPQNFVGRCRQLLRAASQHDDTGAYVLNGVSISDYPNLLNVQQCDRAGIYEDYFSWHSTVVALVAERLEQCQINATAALDEPGPSSPAPLMNAILSSDVDTAERLLAAGANPFVVAASDAGSTPGLHIAAFQGADEIVALLLAAAHAKSSSSLRDLVTAKDLQGRHAVDVALSDKAICLLQAAGVGRAPVDAGCPAKSSAWHLKTGGTLYTPGAGDAHCQAGSVGCGTDTATETVFGNAAGWQKHTGMPPLAADIGSNYCDIPEINGAIDSDAFIRQFRSLRKPVIFRGAAAKWGAMSKWGKKYLTNMSAGIEVACGAIP